MNDQNGTSGSCRLGFNRHQQELPSLQSSPFNSYTRLPGYMRYQLQPTRAKMIFRRQRRRAELLNFRSTIEALAPAKEEKRYSGFKIMDGEYPGLLVLINEILRVLDKKDKNKQEFVRLLLTSSPILVRCPPQFHSPSSCPLHRSHRRAIKPH